MRPVLQWPTMIAIWGRKSAAVKPVILAIVREYADGHATRLSSVSRDALDLAGLCRDGQLGRGVEVGDLHLLRQLGQAPRGEWPPPDGAPDRARNGRRDQAAGGHQLELASCHTAKIDGYVIEGHVPAPDIKRLVVEHPDAVGLTVPGMPVGAPGMEQGAESEPYDVLLIKKDGTTEVFAHH